MRHLRNFIKKMPFKWKVTGTIIGLPIFGLFCLATIVYFLGPPPLTFEENTLLYGTNEEVIGYEQGSENRQVVALDHIADSFIDALLVTEDQHFFSHNGFDYKRIAGALLEDVQHLSLKEGASTITQQYARNLYLTNDKTWMRKAKEAFYTMRLERFYTKDELLAGYMNTIYFGHGAHGIEAASKHFFNKSADALTIAESAMLAGIPKGPTYYSPRNDEERATDRQQLILRTMYTQGKISEEEWQEAMDKRLVYAPVKEGIREAVAPHFQDAALQEAAARLNMSVADVQSGGYRIFTTLDPDMQHVLDDEMEETLQDGTEIEGGGIVMDPETGAVRALVGGKSYADSYFNRAVHAKRMVGSTVKPLLYYAALDHQFTPSTQLMSEPTTFQIDADETYRPRNYNGYYANEPITLAQALALSDNVYAVKTHLFIGSDTLTQLGPAFGITSALPEVPSLALGTASISLVEMVTAYSHIANYGNEVTSHTVEKITDPFGNVLYEYEPHSDRHRFDENKMAVLTSMLTGMFNPALNGYMNVTGEQISGELSRTYAGKSGSTPSDSWMIGFSPTLVTGVWIGFDDNRSIEKTVHTTYAKDIWARVMEQIHTDEDPDSFPLPEGVVEIAVDPQSGKRATANCPQSTVLVYEKGTEPTTYCREHPSDDGQPSPQSLFRRLFDLF